jgi:hypothetical protein
LSNKCITSDTINNTTKIKKISRAISAIATAMPVKPKIPAIIEIMKKVITHVNISKVVLVAYKRKDAINIIRKIIKRILAMLAAATATPVNPKIAAITATIKNVNAHANIMILLI